MSRILMTGFLLEGLGWNHVKESHLVRKDKNWTFLAFILRTLHYLVKTNTNKHKTEHTNELKKEGEFW